jgi:DHA2 family multidrug resistance protein
MAFAIQAIALWNMSLLNTQMSFADAAIARLIQALGLPFLFIPISNAGYVGLPPEESNQASALINMTRNLGGTFGISLVQTMLVRREQVHQSHYVETLNPLNHEYTSAIAQITHALMNHGMSQAQASKAAVAQLYKMLGQQVSMLSYIDVFHLLMVMVLAVIPLVLLMQKPDRQGDAAAP